MSPIACVLSVSLATAGPGTSAPASLPVVIEETTFQVRLPKGWHPKLVGPSGESIPASPGPGPSGESNLKDYEGPEGPSLAVEVDPDAHGFCADADWKVRSNGNRIEIVEEGRLAPPSEGDAEPDDEGCVAGDRVGIATQFDIKGHSYLVIFWTDRQRTGTDLPVFRAILRSFRAK